MSVFRCITSLFLTFLFVGATFAQDSGQESFAGLNFGVGLSLTHDLGDNDRVGGASVVNGIVRVNDENNHVARIMLESHYFFSGKKSLNVWGTDIEVEPERWGVGPFVAVQPGNDEIIEAIGLGIMWGFKKDRDDDSSWNIGIGAVVDPNVQVLGKGIENNQRLPEGETEIRFREKSQIGALVLVSFGFN